MWMLDRVPGVYMPNSRGCTHLPKCCNAILVLWLHTLITHRSFVNHLESQFHYPFRTCQQLIIPFYCVKGLQNRCKWNTLINPLRLNHTVPSFRNILVTQFQLLHSFWVSIFYKLLCYRHLQWFLYINMCEAINYSSYSRELGIHCSSREKLQRTMKSINTKIRCYFLKISVGQNRQLIVNTW